MTQGVECAEVVLVVDDDPGITRALDRSLRRLGYEVLVAPDGAQGLKLALERQPPVILLDIRMPEMDGHTMLRRLGQNDIDSAVVVMSAHGDMNDVVEVLRHGAVDYLKKPWAPSELVAAIARAQEVHDKRRRARASLAAEPPAPEEADPSEPCLDPRRDDLLIPPLPAMVGELRSLVDRPDAGIEDAVSVLERDPTLARGIVEVAGAVDGVRCADARAACERLGLRLVPSAALTVFAHGCFAVPDPTLAAVRARIWRHSVARAVSMRAVADLCALDGEIAYLAGLLGDVGASFLLSAAAARADLPAEKVLAHVRANHQKVGAAVLTSWGVDPHVVVWAASHHAATPPAPPSPYWSIGILAAELADDLTSGDDPTSPGPRSAPLVERCAADLGIGRTTVHRVQLRLASELEGILRGLGATAPS